MKLFRNKKKAFILVLSLCFLFSSGHDNYNRMSQTGKSGVT